MRKLKKPFAAVGFYDSNRRSKRKWNRLVRALVRERHAADDSAVDGTERNDGFPVRTWSRGGEQRRSSGYGSKEARDGGVKVASHTASTACPYVAGPSLGANGVLIGRDMHGGGPFCFDPWVAYALRFISGMSMLVFGTVGMGKSSLVKSMVIRLVLAGRLASIASDLKGEWTEIIRALGGSVIQVGPGLHTRLNPLDEGIRPSLNQQGLPMSDDDWQLVVRTRRLSIMETLIKILTGTELSAEEHAALEEGVDAAVEAATALERTPTVVDVIDGLNGVHDPMLADSAGRLALTLRRMTSGALAGMFDGESTVDFAADAPAVSIDTSSMRGADAVARRIVTACCSAWMESMITNSDGGQRVVVYEEGWDSMSSQADLQRMVAHWKLARDYGIFNILVLHKVSDLNMAGDSGSAMAAMAKSLLADADVKVIYRQDSAALRLTMEELELNERERAILKTLPKGQGLWRVGQATFEVANELSAEEMPLLDTDARMDVGSADPGSSDELVEVAEADSAGEPLPEWLAVS